MNKKLVAQQLYRIKREFDQSIAASGEPVNLATLASFSALREQLLKSTIFKGGELVLLADGSSSSFNSLQGAIFLCRKVLYECEPMQAILKFKDLVRDNEAWGKGVLVLQGVVVEGSHRLTDSVELLPFENLPPSKHTQEALKGNRLRGIRITPKAALTIPMKIAPLFETKVDDWMVPGEILPGREDLRKIRLLAAVVTDSNVDEIGYWFQFDDNALDSLTISGFAPFFPEPLGYLPPADVNVEVDELRTLCSGYFSTAKSMRKRLDIAIKRYSYSLRRDDPSDSVLDLAIVFESLLMDDEGAHTYKLALRSGLLLGGTIEQRLTTRAIVTAIYRYRSNLVHGGAGFKPGKSKSIAGFTNAHDLVKAARRICRAIIFALLEKRRLPDWPQLEMSGNSQEQELGD